MKLRLEQVLSYISPTKLNDWHRKGNCEAPRDTQTQRDVFSTAGNTCSDNT